MGGVQSAPSKTEMPQVLNFILQEMFRRTDLADIYSLADPERCKRYIIVATDALESLFIKMSIRPDKKDGVLFFQSIEGLQRSMPQDVRDKQREYCIELAFFFIRIFQIFGALFLSMYDSKLPITDPSDDIRSVAKGVPFLNPKDFLGFSKPAQSSSWFGAGGALYDNARDVGFYINVDSPYSILNHHLTKPSGPQDTRTPMRFESGAPFTISQDQLYDIGNNFARTLKPILRPRVVYYFERASRNYQLSAQLNIENLPPNDYKVWLSEFIGEEGNFSGKTSVPAVFGTFTADSIPRIRNDDVYKKNQTLPQVLKAMFDKVVIATLGEPPFSVVKYFKKLRYISGDNDKNQLINATHVYVLRGQEDNDTAKISYSDKIKIEGKTETIQIKNVVLRIKPAKSSLGLAYKVTLDFSVSDVNPSDYRNLIEIPSTKESTFNTSSEDIAPRADKNNDSIPEYLERVFREIVNGNRSDRIKGFQYTREGLVRPYDSTQIKDSLKVKKLWDLMAKDPPIKSHCVARAVQLLSIDAINGNLSKQAYSSICRLSFGYQKDGSLPTPGKSVEGSAGIYAMSLLFFEGLENGAPKILDPVAYKEYLRYLKYLFERYPSTDMIKDEPYVPGQVRNADATPVRIADITEKSLSLCKPPGDARLSVPRDLAGNLRSVTTALFSQQQAHFQKAIGLIFSLFDQNSVQVEKKLKFNPRIIAGGMAEINRIAAGTRELLLEYYKGCELTYREGLLMIYNYEKQTGKKLESTAINEIRSGSTTTSTTTVPLNNNNNNNLS
jgi:hypothetical protein